MLNIAKQDGVITFTGELNRDTVVNFWPFTLLKNVSGELIFDLTALEHVDTAGLAWLLQQLGQAKNANIQVKLRNTPQQLKSLALVSDVFALLPLES
jgi:phospholipid transport system transporter-binding protein